MSGLNSALLQHQPLKFHPIHGENVQLSENDRMATRPQSYCKAVAFSSRPIRVDETICIRLVDVRTEWNGVLRIGITNKNPATFAENMPRFVCPDMVAEPGTWAKALSERACIQGNVVSFYVRENGDMFIGVNGNAQGLFLAGINTQLPMYVVVDIYGNTMAIEFLEDLDVPAYGRQAQAPATNARNVVPATSRPNPPVSIPATPWVAAAAQLAALAPTIPAAGPQIPAPPQRPAPIAVPTVPPATPPVQSATTQAQPVASNSTGQISASPSFDVPSVQELATLLPRPPVSPARIPAARASELVFIGRTRLPDYNEMAIAASNGPSVRTMMKSGDSSPALFGTAASNAGTSAEQTPMASAASASNFGSQTNEARAATPNSATASASAFGTFFPTTFNGASFEFPPFSSAASSVAPAVAASASTSFLTQALSTSQLSSSSTSTTVVAPSASAAEASSSQRPVIQSVSEQRQRDILERVNASRTQHDLLMANNRRPPTASIGTDYVNSLPMRFQAGLGFTPLQFHNIHGLNVKFNDSRTMAGKNSEGSDHGYAFTSKPIRPYEKLVIQIAFVAPGNANALGFGVTNCDPIKLISYIFPEDPFDFDERNEFWAVKPNVAGLIQPSTNDEFGFFMDNQGNVFYDRNGQTPEFVMCVDPSLMYYFFFDVCGTTRGIRLVGTAPMDPSYVNRLRSDGGAQPAQASIAQASSQQIRPTGALMVRLPPAPAPNIVGPTAFRVPPANTMPARVAPPAVPTIRNPFAGIPPLIPSQALPAPTSNMAQGPRLPNAAAAAQMSYGGPSWDLNKECAICMVDEVKCAMYPCGHACSCVKCGDNIKQTDRKCPICRGHVIDVVKLFYAV